MLSCIACASLVLANLSRHFDVHLLPLDERIHIHRHCKRLVVRKRLVRMLLSSRVRARMVLPGGQALDDGRELDVLFLGFTLHWGG